MFKNKTGFTLIELLVVISIMAILTVITVSQFNTAKKKARDVQRKGDLNALTKALDMYFADYGVLPLAYQGKISVERDVGIVWGNEFIDKGYTYMKVTPKENYLTAFPYCYAVSADLKSYNLFAHLENTSDIECHLEEEVGSYLCNGVRYCYGVASPNAVVGGIVGVDDFRREGE